MNAKLKTTVEALIPDKKTYKTKSDIVLTEISSQVPKIATKGLTTEPVPYSV